MMKSKTVKVTNQQTGTTQSWTNDSLASSLQLAALYMASHPGHSFTVEVPSLEGRSAKDRPRERERT